MKFLLVSFTSMRFDVAASLLQRFAFSLRAFLVVNTHFALSYMWVSRNSLIEFGGLLDPSSLILSHLVP